MKTFAVITGNSVSNVIIANTKEDAELATNSTCIEYTEENPAAIGWLVDETGVFYLPVAEEEPLIE